MKMAYGLKMKQNESIIIISKNINNNFLLQVFINEFDFNFKLKIIFK